MQKTKILFLIHTLQVGGAERALVNLVNNLNPEKFDITVMTVIDTGAFRNKLPNRVLYKTIIKFPLKNNSKNNIQKSGNLLSRTSKLKNIAVKLYQFGWKHINPQKIYKKFITEKYDIEVAFLEGITAKIISHSNNPNSKKIAWIHVDLLNERKSEKFFNTKTEEKTTYQKFDQIVAVSNTVKAQFEKKFQYNPQKIAVCYNLIDSSKIRKLSNEKSIPKKRFTICTVGRLSMQKGYDRLLQVIKKLNYDNIKFDLWIIGEGAEASNLQEYITKNHLTNVKLLGYKANPYPYIKTADLYVCSSRAEGFSTTVAEAIILGTPVVTMNCSGMHEILGNSEYGIICNNSTFALYKALKKILQNQKQYQILKAHTMKRQDFFDIKTPLHEIEKLLYKVKYA